MANFSDDELPSPELRSGLPSDLSALSADHPRATWPAHPRFFHGLAGHLVAIHNNHRAHGLQLHEMAEIVLAEESHPEPQRLCWRVDRFIRALETHHRLEDARLFPDIRRLDARINHGVALLESDHRHLHIRLVNTQSAGRDWLSAPTDRRLAVAWAKATRDLVHAIGRHLDDEEDLVVPVLLRTEGHV